MKKSHLSLALCLGLSFLPAPASTEISLEGKWRCVLDREDAGIHEKWASRELSGTIELPGDLVQRGLGDPVLVDTKWIGDIIDRSYFNKPEFAKYREPDNIKIPFWLQPERHYVGPAWFQREIDIPGEWAGQRVLLSLERVHWESRVWLDGVEIGHNDSLSTPHEYALGTHLQPGRHTLTIRVDNRYLIPIGPNSHSISDHTQGNWNGIIGRLSLRATAATWIDDLQVYPHVSTKSVTIKGRIGGADRLPAGASLRLTSPSAEPLNIAIGSDGRFKGDFVLRPGAELWDEFNPVLHQITATLPSGETRTTSFGLREIATNGTQFSINGRPIQLRGTLECAIFPKTGHPPTDVESWKRVLRIARAHGLNHLRFHSWCPPEAAFVAGDEIGFYFQIEVASWPNQGAEVGSGQPNDAWQVRETDRIVRSFGNHPSFTFLVSGNEPAGPYHDSWLTYWLERMKAADSRRLYANSSGWPELAAGQFQILQQPRIHQWKDNLKSRINAKPPETVTDYRAFIAPRKIPVVSHEIGQWCVYPNFDEIAKYTGYLKPKNFEIFRESLEAHGMAQQARDFLHASGKLQALCYKEEIESTLRTPGMGGFQLLDLHDFPGQGTALVGVLDPFWEEKGYISASEFQRFCGPTVPLARLTRRVFTTTDSLEAEIEVSHFGATPLNAVTARWQLVGPAGKVFSEGALPVRDLPLGSAIPLGRINVNLQNAPAPARMKLIVSLPGTEAVNDWDIWVYPEAKKLKTDPANIAMVSDLDSGTVNALEQGATVFLCLPPSRVAPDPQRGKVEIGFSSIFWNTAWTSNQAPHTLGILCDPAHPAFAQFPTDSHSNWQWWYPVSRSAAMILDALPRDLQPIVQVIDDWVTNRKLGLVFEAGVGRGKIIVSSIDFEHGQPDPVRRQLRASLLAYAMSPQFNPKVEVTSGQLRQLITTPGAKSHE